MPIIQRSETTTLGQQNKFKELVKKTYSDDEIKEYNLREAIEEHPLASRPTLIRSKMAYKEIMKNSKSTTKYMLPGNVYMFFYSDPKLKEELEYYDRTPLILSIGLVRTKDNVIREVGLNLHYFPPFAREKILSHTYEVFKPWFDSQFNDPQHKVSKFMSYTRLKHIMKTNTKIGFGIKMYIPILRGATYQIPTRLLSTAYYTEGHFSKSTLANIFKFWRKFKP